MVNSMFARRTAALRTSKSRNLRPRTFIEILLVGALLIPLAGAAAVVPQGVWKGTLGKKAIIACFNKGDSGSSDGSYYYLEHLEPIAIRTTEKDPYWHEEKDTGVWELAAPSRGAVSGVWRNLKTRKSLPIRLMLLDGNHDEAACARDSYNARLESYPKVMVGKWQQFSPGRLYRKLQFAGQVTIELSGPDPAVPRLNELLKLDRSKEAIAAYFAQRREFLGRVGYPAVDERDTDPVYWDSNFIQIKFYEWVAGEGRAGISIMHRTWDARNGAEVDPWKWLAGSTDNGLPPKLKKFLYRNTKEAPECADGYKGEGAFTLLLSHGGISFEEEAWGDGCDKSFFMSFKELKPFLSTAGKRAVETMTRRQ